MPDGEPPRDLRSLGLDLGEKRIGVALCDSAGLLATPYEVVLRSGSTERDHREIARLADEAGARQLVVGLPRALDGSQGPAAQKVLDEVAQLRAALGLPVHVHDERLTTVTAHQHLRQAGVGGRKRRGLVDQVAAAVILQAWLDAGAPVSPDGRGAAGMLDGTAGSPRRRDGDA